MCDDRFYRFIPTARASGDRNSETFYKRDERRIRELEKEVAELKQALLK